MVNPQVRKFLSEIGRKGGKKSKRKITPEQQAKMQSARMSKISKDRPSEN